MRYTTLLLSGLLIVLITIGPVSGENTASEHYAIIVQNVGAGLARDLRGLLLDGGWDENNILCYGGSEPFSQFCSGESTSDEFLAGFDSIADEITDRDTLLVAFICHMAEGYLINNTLSGEELNERLSGLPESVTVVLILEGCHTAGLIPKLTTADLAYASAGPNQACYGGWMWFFLDALGRDEDVYNLADTDGNGFVSFGEAYDYAADEERLADWYAALSRDVWPPSDFYPVPARTDGELGYYFYLDPSAPAPF